MDSIKLYLFSILIIVLIFLALRSVMLWYYKIDKIVENQVETQIILKDILSELRKNNKKDSRYLNKE